MRRYQLLAGSLAAAVSLAAAMDLEGKETAFDSRVLESQGGSLSLASFLEPRHLYLEKGEETYDGPLIMTENLEVLVCADGVRQFLGISVLVYPDSRILLQKGIRRAELLLGDPAMCIGQVRLPLKEAPREIDEMIYLPLEALQQAFGYRYDWNPGTYRICIAEDKKISRSSLPDSYDYRAVGKAPPVKDQGTSKTCWSFAALTALESARYPRWQQSFSVDHMSAHNSYALEQEAGGEYTMSMAYLLAWQGPVLEESDPYNDGISPEGLEAAVHVQEIQILPEKDYEAIKEAVFLYGGVQSSLYTSMADGHSDSAFYDKVHSAYCYTGEEPPNHDVVIVGWDDCYPRENFRTEVEGDGAFLCVNSWGKAFGADGYF